MLIGYNHWITFAKRTTMNGFVFGKLRPTGDAFSLTRS